MPLRHLLAGRWISDWLMGFMLKRCLDWPATVDHGSGGSFKLLDFPDN